jgi:hypothetical protein
MKKDFIKQGRNELEFRSKNKYQIQFQTKSEKEAKRRFQEMGVLQIFNEKACSVRLRVKKKTRVASMMKTLQSNRSVVNQIFMQWILLDK